MLLQRLPVCFGIVAFGISIFFSREIPKILIFIELRAPGMLGSAQNIEAQGLAGKILRNKGLAPRTERPTGWQILLGEQSGMDPVLLFL